MPKLTANGWGRNCGTKTLSKFTITDAAWNKNLHHKWSRSYGNVDEDGKTTLAFNGTTYLNGSYEFKLELHREDITKLFVKANEGRSFADVMTDLAEHFVTDVGTLPGEKPLSTDQPSA